MCGICGVYGLSLMATRELKMFSHLLYINTLRGEDSTGVLKVCKNGNKFEEFIDKSILSADKYITSPDGWQFTHTSNIMLLLGHARAATIGSVTKDNAHPFKFSKVTGVHNGTVRKFFKYDREYDTDSEAIYRGLNDHGLEETLKDIASRTSAYALVWVDWEHGTLNFLRNKERPLHFTYVYNRSALVWSSDMNHLEAVLKSMNTQPSGWHGTEKGGARIWTLTPHMLMTLKLGEKPTTAKIVKIDVDPEPIPPSTVWTYPTTQKTDTAWTPAQEERWRKAIANNYGDWEYDEETGEYIEKDKGKTRTSDLLSRAWSGVRTGKSPKYNTNPPTGESELRYKLKEGCCNCSYCVDPDDKDEVAKVVWYDRQHYFCPDCVGTPLYIHMMDANPF